MSNSERSRRFRERNPGYDRRRKAKERAMASQFCEQSIAALRMKHALLIREPLMLPAPTQRMPLLIGMPDARETVAVPRTV